VKLDLSNWSTRVLCLFLATDLVFIGIHLIHVYTNLAPKLLYSIEAERSYADIHQHIKEYWIVLILGFVVLRRFSALYLGWFLLFLYILIDDTLQIHENLGLSIARNLNFIPVFNLEAKDFGELIVSTVAALFFLIFIGIAYRFGDRLSRKISRSLIKMLFVLALFGIVFDMIHGATKAPSLQPILALLEDGGEQIVMSFIAWFVFYLPERLESETSANSLSLKQEVVATGQSIKR
jgi:hypothetical protein